MALKDFYCQRCGRCCKRLGLPWPWPPSKLNVMADYLKISKADLVNRYYGDIVTTEGKMSVRLDRKRTTPCPFLGTDGDCQIYPVRPVECDLYPFDERCRSDVRLGSFIGIDCPALEE